MPEVLFLLPRGQHGEEIASQSTDVHMGVLGVFYKMLE